MYLKEKNYIIEYGIELDKRGLTFNAGGNLSICDHENKRVIITPSGIDYNKLCVEDICILDFNEETVEGDLKPSSEFKMHIDIYKERNDISALVHSHSKYIGALSALNSDLPAVHYLIASAGGNNVRRAPYAAYGTQELADAAVKYMQDRKAVILANHGLITGSKSLEDAMKITMDLEYVAFIYLTALSAGEPQILSNEDMDIIVERFHGYRNNNIKK